MTNQINEEKKPAQMDLLDETLHFLGKNKIDTNIVHIGANDGYTYDDMRGYIKEYEWGGLFVEPITEYFEDLKENCKNNKNHIFENCAISDADGEIEMLYISKDDIKQNDLHYGYRGMACSLPPRNGFGSGYERDEQVKEKYGTLRFYTTGGDKLTDGMIWFAENMSARTCEVCGMPGKMRGKGWYYAACDEHTQKEDLE